MGSKHLSRLSVFLALMLLGTSAAIAQGPGQRGDSNCRPS